MLHTAVYSVNGARVSVSGRNWTLFCCVFWSHYCIWNAVVQNFCERRGLYSVHGRVRCSCRYVCVLWTLKRDRNMQQNNVRFLPGTATYTCSYYHTAVYSVEMVMICIVDSIKHLAWATGIKWKIRRRLHTKHMEKCRDLLFSCQINYAVIKIQRGSYNALLKVPVCSFTQPANHSNS